MNDVEFLKSLHAALSRETDPVKLRLLFAELDRFIYNQVKRARRVPVWETR